MDGKPRAFVIWTPLWHEKVCCHGFKTFVVARATYRQRGLLLIRSRVFTLFNVKFVSAVIILKGRWDAVMLGLLLNPQRYRTLARIRCGVHWRCLFVFTSHLTRNRYFQKSWSSIHSFTFFLYLFVFSFFTGEICDVLATASEDANIKLIICILFSITRVKCSKTPDLLSQSWFGIDDGFFNSDYLII